jgi:mannose-6-phosphate isomerase-like protein (cupin superfamily)
VSEPKSTELGGDPAIVGRRVSREYRWRDVCRGWTLASHDSLHVVLEEMPPRTEEVRHLHSRVTQFYFILRGEATVRLGDRTLTLFAEDGVEIAAEVPHQIRNDRDDTLEFLVVSSSAPREDRVDLPD